MADFLTRMTQRTLGLLPVVQPIIASKYGSEAMPTDMQGGPVPVDSGQPMEESFEDWEGMAERLPPAPLPQPVVPRGIRTSAASVPGVTPPVASSQEQPSTAGVQQAEAAAPVRLHAVPPSRETPFLPGQAPPLLHTNTTPHPDPTRVEVGLDPAPAIEATPTVLDVSTTKPGRGQKQSGEVLQMPLTGRQEISHNEASAVRDYPHVSDSSTESPTLVSSSSPMSAAVGGNPLVSRRIVADVPGQGAEPQIVPNTQHDTTPGWGQALLVPSTKHNDEPGQGAEPQLVASARLDTIPGQPVASTKRETTPGQGRALPVASTKSDDDLYRIRAGLAPALEAVRSMALPPALVSTAQGAEAPLIEPGFPSLYTSAQTRRTETTVTGKQAATQFPESHDAPTIRVTIGRIDVRAVPPTPSSSPAPTKSNRARPALSLSDYLKQRKGGQR